MISFIEVGRSDGPFMVQRPFPVALEPAAMLLEASGREELF
jgi:hypothetical protein